MSRDPRSERHLALAWSSALAPQPDLIYDYVLAHVQAQPTRHHTGYPTPQEHRMSDGHHLPAALTQPGELPPPIAFPQRPANARTAAPSESTRQRWARMAKAEADARAAAHEEGELQGYRQGWRWGLACGVVAGALLACVGWGAWLVLHVPSAVPMASAGLL